MKEFNCVFYILYASLVAISDQTRRGGLIPHYLKMADVNWFGITVEDSRLTVSKLVIFLNIIWIAFIYPYLTSEVRIIRNHVWVEQYSLCEVFLVVLKFMSEFVCDMTLYFKILLIFFITYLLNIVVYIVVSCFDINKLRYCCYMQLYLCAREF